MKIIGGIHMADKYEHRRHRRSGLPYGHLIWPLVIGIILICTGLSDLVKIDIWQYIWPMIAIVLGILVITGGILSSRK